MDVKELYAQKGEIVTRLEILQAQLQNINKQIVDAINLQNAPTSASEKTIEQSDSNT